MARPKRCDHSSSSSESMEQKQEISKGLTKSSHETTLGKCFLSVGANTEGAAKDFWSFLSNWAVTSWRK